MTARAPWLAHYDRDVPASLAPYPKGTLVDYLADLARDRPNGRALLFKGATMTWGTLERDSNAFASALASFGVSRGDRVALLLPNCPQFVVAQMAIWKLGAIVAPLNPLYTESELEGPLNAHGVETIVTLTRYYKRIKSLQPRTKLRRVIAANIKDYFPPLLRVLFTLLRETRDGDRVALADGDFRFMDVVATHAGRTPNRARITADDPAVLLMSGGTTGTAKGVLGRHAAYTLTGLQLHAWTRSAFNEGENVIFLPLPLFHVYAHVGVQGLAFVAGHPLALVPNPRDLPDLLATIRKVKPAFFNGVPTLYIALLNHPDVQSGKVDFKSVKICFSGAAALLADTKTRFEALTGARIVEGYSLTEAMMACCVNPVNGENKTGSVGMPLPDVAVRIYDGEEGRQVLPAGEVGEICLQGLQLMTGFWNRPEETAEVLRKHVDEDAKVLEWVHTGDLGYMDDDGYVFIVDRKKDLIKTSGYQVWPREIEEAIAAHPAVAEVGVAGVPDPVRGEAVHAWVVLRQGQIASEADLRAFCRQSLAPYKVPHQIQFRPDLPKTMVGKVLRRALRDSVKGP